MGISTDIVRDFLLVRLQGDFDMHTAPVFKDKVIKKMEENSLKKLIINLEGVRFIDSTGLGAILGRYRSITGDGGKLLLAGVNPQVKKILNLSGVLEIIPVFESEKNLVKKIKRGNNIA